MLERYTDRARRVMYLANQEAQRLRNDHVGTEHLLLGLVKEGTGLAGTVLREMGINLESTRLAVEKVVHGPSGADPVSGTLPRTDRLKRVLDFSNAEATDLGHNYVGTEHLLLGLLREPEGMAASVLKGLKLKLEDVRSAVLSHFGRAPLAKDALMDRAMRDLDPMLCEEEFHSEQVRSTVEALIIAGWRPQS